LLKTNLKDVAQYYHAQAQRSKSVADYQEAAKWYHSYLTSFPMTRIRPSPTTCSRHLVREQAISRRRQGYESTAYHYGNHEKAAAAGYAAILPTASKKRR